jgi:hypothetical protein
MKLHKTYIHMLKCPLHMSSSGRLGDRAQDVGVANVGDAEHGGAEHLTARGTHRDVVCARATRREHTSQPIARHALSGIAPRRPAVPPPGSQTQGRHKVSPAIRFPSASPAAAETDHAASLAEQALGPPEPPLAPPARDAVAATVSEAPPSPPRPDVRPSTAIRAATRRTPRRAAGVARRGTHCQSSGGPRSSQASRSTRSRTSAAAGSCSR